MAGGRREILEVDGPAAGERLDRFLARLLGAPRKAIKKALDGGQVFVDGRTVRRAGELLNGGETIRITLEEASPPAPSPQPELLYQDEELLALAKPPRLPSHPTVAGGANALDWVRAFLGRQGRAAAPILLHRLDADTSGVLLLALTTEANRALAAAFADREVEKVYLALVAGTPPDDFAVSNFLRPGRRGRIEAVRAGGQPAETLFRTLARQDGLALVEARPQTGRTHQIRVHLAGAGYPILGDRHYGGATAVSIAGGVLPVPRHLLHAWKLGFRHPASGERVVLEAPLPPDFEPFRSLTQARH
ncbi:MAG: RluA family pseudouridine synthase [Desulfuromonadales bacterium]|nr:RluA family pseudouridine synthase [Desulfuromonadales bacterium]